jgi:hypothetical protein
MPARSDRRAPRGWKGLPRNRISPRGRTRAVQGLEEFGAAGAEQSADTDDLAAPHGKADAVGFAAPGPIAPGREREVGDPQDLLARLDIAGAEHGLHRAADHRLGRRFRGQLAGVEPGDHRPVAQDRRAVGDAADLVHPVGDVDDPDTSAA